MLAQEGTAAFAALLGGALHLHHLAAPSLAGFPAALLGIGGPWLGEPERLGLDLHADPGLSEVLEARRGRVAAVDETLAGLTSAELERVTVPPETPGHPPAVPHTAQQCLHTILNEEWWHRRYAERDLDAALSRPSGGRGTT